VHQPVKRTVRDHAGRTERRHRGRGRGARAGPRFQVDHRRSGHNRVARRGCRRERRDVVDGLIARQRIYGTLDTLDNLKKGGRIGGAQALLGSMLSIKPLVDLSSGAVEEAGRTRTRKKAFAWLRDAVVRSGEIENLRVIHGEAPDIDDFLAMLADEVDLSTVQIGSIGPVIGTHGGPRVVGVAFHVKP